MKKILIINGNPAKEGFSSFLVSNYQKGAKNCGAEVKLIDLAKLDFDPIYRGYSDKRPLEKDLVKAQQLILWANHVVFIYPTWWGAMPALLKGFIDKAFTPGFAYKYGEKGKLNRLLKGRTGRIITSTGSPRLYSLANHALLTGSLKYPVLKFCGFGAVKTTVFPAIRKNLTEERKNQIAEKCVWLGKRDARHSFRCWSFAHFNNKF